MNSNNKTTTKDNFTFDEKRHRYTLDGKPITGVTTIFNVLNSPWLVQWAADEAVRMLGWLDVRYEDEEKVLQSVESKRKAIADMTTSQFYELVCNARVAYTKKRDKAGDIGKKAHKWIEDWIKDPTLAPDPELNHITSNFVQWAKDNKVKFLESEMRLFSRKYWYAGTMDLVMEIDGKIWIGDLKTSSGISPRNFFQTAAYQNALQEMGLYPKIEGNVIINCKKNGEFAVERSYGYESNLKGFLACLQIYKSLEELQITTGNKK